MSEKILSPQVRNREVVRENRVYIVEEPVACANSGPAGAGKVVDDLLKFLVKD